MRQLLRILLIWLVTFAIPSQGMAAATMQHCGPAHHGADARSTAQAMPNARHTAPEAHAAHAAHGHAGHLAQDAVAVSHADEIASLSIAFDDGPTNQATDSVDSVDSVETVKTVKTVKSASQKCSACASCCAGLALSSAAVIPPTIDAAREVSVLSPSRAANVFVDGPERPPRNLRA